MIEGKTIAASLESRDKIKLITDRTENKTGYFNVFFRLKIKNISELIAKIPISISALPEIYVTASVCTGLESKKSALDKARGKLIDKLTRRISIKNETPACKNMLVK